ncbi:MAG: hypothetical protein HWD89_07460 [Tenacibaculum sp.]|uniref:hypothetical protein n=1 Tax=Tenacibaculum sp. TaxID=1906242 RepID=UPI00178EB681|nr:hypothetical protein [Tenacibaculum sp.]NVK08875.1 hypothetical protein [Tenacibaculum sp.]
MHYKLHKELSIQTALLQFYCFLTRGFWEKEFISVFDYGNENIEKIHTMANPEKWDGDYSTIIKRISKTKEIVEKAKSYLQWNQKCSNEKIAEYMYNHPLFYENGISIKDLNDIMEINTVLKNGYMFHDRFHGYPEKHLYRYGVDCLDFLYSASYFYNEGFDFFNNRKNPISNNEIHNLPSTEMKRIQSKEEMMFRSFREAFINIIFFVESFINSVGYDAYLKGKGVNESEKNKLKGIKSIKANGFKSYLSIRGKFKEYSRIISGTELDTENPIIENYIKKCVELRNKYVHSSPEKGSLKVSLEEWKNKCDSMIDKQCFEVLNTFWKGCYPDKQFPVIIYNELSSSSFKGRLGKMMIARNE